MNQRFAAPWSVKLKITTAALLVVVGTLVIAQGGLLGTAVLLGIILGCAAFAVRGYSVSDRALLVHRFGWTTRIDLSKLQGIDVAPYVTAGSMRTFGIGGLFGFVGLFQNAALGNYLAYATDAAKAVVLDVGDRRIVVTPDRPDDFVAAIRERLSA